MRTRAGVGVGVVAILAAVGLPPALAAPSKARPDLRIATGSVVLSGTATVSGRFVVANGGTRTAARSTAVLIAGTGPGRSVAKRIVVPALKPKASRTFTLRIVLARRLRTGTLRLRVCADANHRQRERSEANNCRWVGSTAKRTAPGTTTGTSAAPPTTTAPASTWVAPQPIAFPKDQPFDVPGAKGDYWAYVPSSYDATPTTALLWLHGCGGKSQIDAPIVSTAGSKHYISILPGGREGDCWGEDDAPAALAALADAEQHFNIDPHRVIVAGFSSGGDLAYDLAFANAGLFAGVLGVNCQPFADEGASSMAEAAWRFHAVQLAHTEDEAYNIADVRRKTDAMAAAGFPITRVERPGHHWDSDVNGVGGTINDYLTYLLVHVDDGWRSP
jgi:hypothetical protein